MPYLLERLHAAAASQDPHALAVAAHALLGPLQNLCACRCADSVLQLGRLAEEGKISAATAVLELVCAELERLTTALASLA